MTYIRFRRLKIRLGLNTVDSELGFEGLRIDGALVLKSLPFSCFQTQIRSDSTMSALSKVEMSVFFLLVVRFGGYGSDGRCADEQARAESD